VVYHTSQAATTAPPPPVLRCVGVTKYFGAVRALNHVNLALAPGVVVALVGDNGAGKSTLVRIISGLHQPDAGEIWLQDRLVRSLSPREARDWGIEAVHQQLALCDNLDATANVTLGREPVRFSIGPFRFIDRKASLREARERIGVLGTRLDSFTVPVRRFSGGQRQAISLARATARGRKVVIFDEPTAALGVRQKRRALDLVNRVAERGMAVLLISHNLDEVFEVADRIVVLRLGAVALEADKAATTREAAVAAMTGIQVGR
jgi:ABC-type sugar transport system ATPase subunit